MKPEETQYRADQPRKLSGKVALINDGDTGVGRAVAALFAREGAGVALSRRHEATAEAHIDSEEDYLLLSGDSADIGYCIDAVERTLIEYGSLDILVNNTAPGLSAGLTESAGERGISNFLTSTLFMTQSALFYMAEGATIINTIPVVQQSPCTSDYVAARLSLTSFTRALAKELESKQIRVNAVGVGISSALPEDKISPERDHGLETQCIMPSAEEVAASFLFLASRDSYQMTGQVLYPTTR